MATISPEIEAFIRQKVAWEALPLATQQQLGSSSKEYEKAVTQFSIRCRVTYHISQYRCPVCTSHN